jgi:hypothetical protein
MPLPYATILPFQELAWSFPKMFMFFFKKLHGIQNNSPIMWKEKNQLTNYLSDFRYLVIC